MTIPGFLVLFVCIWWLLLFMALPIGRKPDFTTDANGAPARPRLGLKTAWVTAITTIIMVSITLADYVNIIDMNRLFLGDL